MRTPMLTPIVRTLIVINVIVFMVQSFNSHYNDQITSLFGLHYFTSERFNPIQFVSYMFVHGSFMHIFSNMLGLFFITATRKILGRKTLFGLLLYYRYRCWTFVYGSEVL
jgi:membrane associated rhomboid family serine protease